MDDKDIRYNQIFAIAKQKVIERWGVLTSNPAGVKVNPPPDAYMKAVAELTASFGVGVLPADLITIAGSINDQIIIFLTTLNYRAEAFPALAFQALNPNTATGYPNDAISALSGAFRIPARPTVFICNVEGSAGAVVPSLTPITTVITNATNYTYVNPDPIVLNEQGKGSGVFICTTDGEIPLLPNTKWQCDAYVQGVSTFTNPTDNMITIGNDATTDAELHYIRQFAIYQNANGGMSSIQGKIYADANLSSQITTALVQINNNNADQGFPENPDIDSVYTIPKWTIVVAVAMPDTDQNAQYLAKILWQNTTGCKTGYPLDCPTDPKIQKSVLYEYTPNEFKTFKYIIPQELLIEFSVSYQITGYKDPSLDSQIKELIINQFRKGTISVPRVVGGLPFFVQTFRDILTPLKLYNLQLFMKITGDQYKFQEIICTAIWRLPVVTEDSIFITAR